jgi:hypothetical protein
MPLPSSEYVHHGQHGNYVGGPLDIFLPLTVDAGYVRWYLGRRYYHVSSHVVHSHAGLSRRR